MGCLKKELTHKHTNECVRVCARVIFRLGINSLACGWLILQQLSLIIKGDRTHTLTHTVCQRTPVSWEPDWLIDIRWLSFGKGNGGHARPTRDFDCGLHCGDNWDSDSEQQAGGLVCRSPCWAHGLWVQTNRPGGKCLNHTEDKVKSILGVQDTEHGVS